MLWAYLNYPNSNATVHGNGDCGQIQMMNKPGQRLIQIDATTIGSEIATFLEKKHRFASQAELNDMWLAVDFEDGEFEFAVVGFLFRTLGQSYKPLRDCELTWHCQFS